MISSQEEIKEKFDSLLQKSGKVGHVHIRIDESAPIKIYAACVFPSKNLMLEIGPIKNAWLPKGFKAPHIKGLTVALKPSNKIPGSDLTLFMELQQREAIDIFSFFAARVCDEINGVLEPKLAVKAVIALVERWKDFFSGSSEILSDAKQTGLYGELFLLNFLTSNEIGLGQTIRAWTGSKKTSQDYEFGKVAIEVKSSSAVDATRVTITNAKQLDESGLDDLFLCRMVFDARQGQENTLPILIEKIRKTIQDNSPESSVDFEEKLISAGYQDKHAEQYSNRSYSEMKSMYFRVDNGFPRLLIKNLPDGVTKVSYEITLNSCLDYKIDSNKVITAIKEMSHD